MKHFITEIKAAITSHQATAFKNFHRLSTTVIANKELLTRAEKEITEWNTSTIFIQPDSKLKANDIIGHEYDAIIYHLSPQINPNLFAAITGTLRSGGIFVLLCDIDDIDKKNYFFQHLLSSISQEEFFLNITISETAIDIKEPKIIESSDFQSTNNIYSQQADAILLIKKVLTGHRRRPLVLTADRGRGKSAAIGIAIGEIIKEREQEYQNKSAEFSVIITAPSSTSAAIIFKHIQIIIPEAVIKNGHINLNASSVTFLSPDNLILHFPKADLLIVEEAAGHNINTLNTILKHYSRIVFATTLHGYEGSGQGFVTRFSQSLNSMTPSWKAFTLNQPIRWAKHDPLEYFIDKVFLLKNELLNFPDNTNIDLEKIEIRIVHHDQLIKDHDLISSVFCLLKSAHYKTSPNDLRQLMNAENSIIFTSYYHNTLIAAAIIEKEGNIPADLAHDIYCGTRRPKGQLIPQSIIMHLGLKEAAQLQHLRIMRIAVLPQLQRKKIGSHLLKQVTQFAKHQSFDCIGTSFGATPELLNYWLSFDFRTLRLGYKKNTFSGCNAALLLLPISPAAKKISLEADEIFFDNFIAQLPSALQDIDANIISTMLNTFCKHEQDYNLPTKVLADVYSFVHYHRSYDDNLASITLFLLHVIKYSHLFASLSNLHSTLIILKIFQNKTWSIVCEALKIKGKKQAISELKLALSILKTE